MDVAWNNMVLTQGNSEPVADYGYEPVGYYGYDPLPPYNYDEDWDPVEIYGYGCFETEDGSWICIDPPYNYGNYYIDCGGVYYYGYEGCAYPYPEPYPLPYYYYNHRQEPESLASVALFSLSSFMMQIGGLAVYTQSIMDRTDGTNYKGMLLAN